MYSIQKNYLILIDIYHFYLKEEKLEEKKNLEMRKTKVTMNKPRYLGMIVLDFSKTHMYEIWYDYFQPKYGDRANL